MKCYHCETENPEGAQFCKKCGRRLDGLSVCTACGKLTPADGEYCIYCGSNRNAPVYTMPLRFPEAEIPKGQYALPAAVQRPAHTEARRQAYAEPQLKARKEKAQKSLLSADGPGAGGSFLPARAAGIVGKISDVAALVTAVLSLIFTFLIGASLKVGTGGVSAGTPGGYSIFYFFGDAYAMTYEGEIPLKMARVGAVFGTVCTVCGLLLVATSAIFFIVRAVKFLQKKTDKGILAPAVMTYLAYLFAVALFMLCISQKVELAGVSTSVSANIGTTAGIVLGAVALAAAVILSVLRQGMEGELRGYLIRMCSAAVYAILAFVAIGLLGNGVAFMTSDALGASASTTQGFLPLFSQIAAEYMGNNTYVKMYNTILALGIILVIAVAAVSWMVSFTLSDILSSPGGSLQKRTPAFAILAGIFFIAAGAMMAAISLVYVGNRGNEAFSASLIVPIVIIVIGVFMSACAIVRKKFSPPQEEGSSVQEDVYAF